MQDFENSEPIGECTTASTYTMDEEDTSPIDNAGLKRKLFSIASSSHPREPFQVSHALKALARRRISTNKGFDIIREQQKQNETEDQNDRSVISEV